MLNMLFKYRSFHAVSAVEKKCKKSVSTKNNTAKKNNRTVNGILYNLIRECIRNK